MAISFLCNIRINCISRNLFCLNARKLSSQKTYSNRVDFGLLFDIDGVIVRGRDILPPAREAFRLLTDASGKFRVPTCFVTNAGNGLRQTRATQLSKWLGVEITADQVVMSHSPLTLYQQFKSKHCLIAGQGPVVEIAHSLGFTRVTTIDTLADMFPMLDMVDTRKRRKFIESQKLMLTAPKHFEKLDAVVLLGEPVAWETALQLIIDVLMTNGHLVTTANQEAPYPHLPVLACGMDLVWVAEAPLPRFGNGCFLHCLETVYQKLTGHKLEYSGLVGKPSTVTYIHSHNVLLAEARRLGVHDIRRIYCIGDNPDVDVYGANLYNRHLQQGLAPTGGKLVAVQQKAVARSSMQEVDVTSCVVETSPVECKSVLVCTGVYDGHPTTRMLNHNHRDFVADPVLKVPAITVDNALVAVQEIFGRESFS